jgi:hypothetical protein
MATGPQKDIVDASYPTKAVGYTSVDLNTDATTDLYDPSDEAVVHGVYLQHGGSTAVVQLEITDGTDTAVLTPGQAAGDGIAFTGPIGLDSGEKIQANVTTKEGSAQSNTAAVSKGEKS